MYDKSNCKLISKFMRWYKINLEDMLVLGKFTIMHCHCSTGVSYWQYWCQLLAILVSVTGSTGVRQLLAAGVRQLLAVLVSDNYWMVTRDEDVSLSMFNFKLIWGSFCQLTLLNDLTVSLSANLQNWCQRTHIRDLTMYAHLVSMDPLNRHHNVCTLGVNGPT